MGRILEEILAVYSRSRHINESDLKEFEIKIEAIKRNHDKYGFIIREGMVSFILDRMYPKGSGDLQFLGGLKREGNWLNSHGYKLSGYLRIKGKDERISLF